MGYRISVVSKNRRKAFEPIWPHHLARVSSFHPFSSILSVSFPLIEFIFFCRSDVSSVAMPKCEKDISYIILEEFRGNVCSQVILLFFFILYIDNEFHFVYSASVRDKEQKSSDYCDRSVNERVTFSCSNCTSIRGHVPFPFHPSLRALATWSRRVTWARNYPLSMIF